MDLVATRDGGGTDGELAGGSPLWPEGGGLEEAGSVVVTADAAGGVSASGSREVSADGDRAGFDRLIEAPSRPAWARRRWLGGRRGVAVGLRRELGGLIEARAGVFVVEGGEAGEAVVAKAGGVELGAVERGGFSGGALGGGLLVEVGEEGSAVEVAPEEVGERGQEKTEGGEEKGYTEARHG